MAGNNNLSPRQKMINLMYIVLTAMLALNVSSDVLNGFKLVEDGLTHSTHSATEQNKARYDELEQLYLNNPTKSRTWYNHSQELRTRSNELYALVEEIKLAIVRKSDGKEGDPTHIKHREDLEAASYIMLSPTQQQGKHLRKMIDAYRNEMVALVPDTSRWSNIQHYLATDEIVDNENKLISWEESLFGHVPVSAAITLLIQIQNDLRYAEGEILSELLKGVDEGDLRVNQLNAFVIPTSQYVMRGGNYSAHIVLAAIDSTQQPTIVVDDQPLADSEGGIYEVTCNSSGTYDYSGYLEVARGNGETERHPFSSSYTVVEPAATVSASLMNVLYAGVENPISISVPGVPMGQVNASISNGTLARKGNGWVAKPTAIGKEVVIKVSAQMNGVTQVVANSTFRVRQLPDPVPFIAFNDADGNPQRYRGGKPLSKVLLLAAPGIEAAMDDDLLNVKYTVLSFETIFFDQMGNAIPEVSDGANFSSRQKAALRRLSRGKRFYISRVRAVGPDGVERELSPLEVIVG